MKKLSWLSIVIIIVGALVSLWFFKEMMFDRYLTSVIRVPISFGRIAVRPSQTKIVHFQIDNPRGFKRKSAFSVNRAKISYQLSHLFKNPVEIQEVLLDGVYLNIELKNSSGSQNNWTEIGKKISAKSSKGKEVIIRKIVLTNITVEVLGLGAIAGLAVPKVQHFDRWEFDEIDSQNGFPTEELIQKIFGNANVFQYIQGAFNEVLKLPKSINPFKLFKTIPNE